MPWFLCPAHHRRARHRRAPLPSRMRESLFVGSHIPGVGDGVTVGAFARCPRFEPRRPGFNGSKLCWAREVPRAAQSGPLLVPLRRAPFEERGDAFARVVLLRVFRHDALRVVVRRCGVEIDLLCRTRPFRARRCRGSPTRCRAPVASVCACSSSGATTRLTRPHASAVAASMGAPVSSISSDALAADRARQRDHRRAAEEPDADARRGERRLGRGDGEIAGGDELTARRGRDPRHLRDHGLRDRGDPRHEVDARVEYRAIRARRRAPPARAGRGRRRTRGPRRAGSRPARRAARPAPRTLRRARASSPGRARCVSRPGSW